MIHLTHTGYNAGHPLCDCHQGAHREMGDTFISVLQAPAKLLASETLCLACKHALLSHHGEEDASSAIPIYWLEAEEVGPANMV